MTPVPCLHKRARHIHGTRTCYILDRCRCQPCKQAAAAVEAYNPCHGGEELNADHIRYCVPFHEWQAAALRGDSDG